MILLKQTDTRGDKNTFIVKCVRLSRSNKILFEFTQYSHE